MLWVIKDLSHKFIAGRRLLNKLGVQILVDGELVKFEVKKNTTADEVNEKQFEKLYSLGDAGKEEWDEIMGLFFISSSVHKGLFYAGVSTKAQKGHREKKGNTLCTCKSQ